MFEVQGWREWLMWPLRNTFKRSSRYDVAMQERVQAYKSLMHDVFGVDHTEEDSMQLIQDGVIKWRDHAQRGEVPPDADVLFELLVIQNRHALDQRKAEGGVKPTTLSVIVDGELRTIVMPQRKQHSLEESYRRLQVMLDHRDHQSPNEDPLPDLRLVK